jgi:hypothetical protein
MKAAGGGFLALLSCGGVLSCTRAWPALSNNARGRMAGLRDAAWDQPADGVSFLPRWLAPPLFGVSRRPVARRARISRESGPTVKMATNPDRGTSALATGHRWATAGPQSSSSRRSLQTGPLLARLRVCPSFACAPPPRQSLPGYLARAPPETAVILDPCEPPSLSRSVNSQPDPAGSRKPPPLWH